MTSPSAMGPASEPPAGSLQHPLTRALLVLTFTAGMGLGALAGALLLKTDLVLPLMIAGVLASLAWTLYVPAGHRHDNRLLDG